jgi:hypothetical protein
MGTKRSRQDSVSSSESSKPFSREQSADIKFVHLDSDSAVSSHNAVNRCSECHKNFPDEHFLHLHIGENHDPINEAKRDKGEKTVGSFT